MIYFFTLVTLALVTLVLLEWLIIPEVEFISLIFRGLPLSIGD
jgi:hypothetical protein